MRVSVRSAGRRRWPSGRRRPRPASPGRPRACRRRCGRRRRSAPGPGRSSAAGVRPGNMATLIIGMTRSLEPPAHRLKLRDGGRVALEVDVHGVAAEDEQQQVDGLADDGDRVGPGLDGGLAAVLRAQGDTDRRLPQVELRGPLRRTPGGGVPRGVGGPRLPVRLRAADVFVVDEELGGVGQLVERADRGGPELRRPAPDLVDQARPTASRRSGPGPSACTRRARAP